MGLVSETREKNCEYVQAATPQNPSDGQTWYNTTDDEAYLYDLATTSWIKLSSIGQSGYERPKFLWFWGSNFRGQFSETRIDRSSPVQVGSSPIWKDFDGGAWSFVGIKFDGSLMSSGSNYYGQLGDGTTVDKSSPVQIGNLTNWYKISVYDYHIHSVKTDGTLWSWGRNNWGQLGDNSTIDKSSPVQVGSLTDWSNISCGLHMTVAIKTDGTLWSWGWSENGELGIAGYSLQRSSPTQIGSLTNWSKISCGIYFSMAVKTDGTLWSWGYNPSGQLGDGTSSDKASPIQIGNLTNWSTAACNYHTLAIKTDGTLWAWGYNNYGRLGLMSVASKASPNQIGNLTTWSKISCGEEFSAAIKTDGTLWTWGRTDYGQLGLNDNSYSGDRSSPTQVGNLTNWKNIGTGNWFAMALK